jgi:hypothetical protein
VESNPDFKDLFRCLNDAGARYLVVGAYAVIFHTEPRYSKDIDIWVEPSPGNADKVFRALARFGAPLADLTVEDLANVELVYQIGVEPNRIDILMAVNGLRFEDAWAHRVPSRYEDQPVSILSLEDTLASKIAAGRPQDLLDAAALDAARKKG